MTTARESIGQRSETVRRANLSAIVRELHVHGPLSRSDLVTRTGLTRSGIRGLIGELVGAGLVDEQPSLPAGTPDSPRPVTLNAPHQADRTQLRGSGTRVRTDLSRAGLDGLPRQRRRKSLFYERRERPLHGPVLEGMKRDDRHACPLPIAPALPAR